MNIVFRRIFLLSAVLLLCSVFQRLLMASEITILTQSELQNIGGYATQVLYCGTGVFDNSDGKYKMWFSAYNSSPQHWAWYYKESPTLAGLANATPQQCLYGDYVDVNIPGGLTVRKLADGSYGMWYSIYYANYPPNGGDDKNFIHYRHSPDGIHWGDQKTVLAPTTNWTDDAEPKAVPLANGKTRLYYYHLESGVQSIRYVDVGSSGTDTSNTYPLYTGGNFLMAGSLIGSPGSNAHHRLWFYTRSHSTPIDLIQYDSYDEGQTWISTDKGPYDGSMGRFVQCFYGANAEEYFIRVNSAGNAIYLSQPQQYQNFDLSVDQIEVNQCIQPAQLIAGKATVIRVFVKLNDSGSLSSVENVTVNLSYRFNGGPEQCADPCAITQRVCKKYAYSQEEINKGLDAFNFYLYAPKKGGYTFTANITPLSGETNPLNNSASTGQIAFNDSKYLHLMPVGIQTDVSGWPTYEDFAGLTNFITKTFPVDLGSVDVTLLGYIAGLWIPFDRHNPLIEKWWFDATRTLNDWALYSTFGSNKDHYVMTVGLLTKGGLGELKGLHYGFPDAVYVITDNTINVANSTKETSNVLAHELGHAIGGLYNDKEQYEIYPQDLGKQVFPDLAFDPQAGKPLQWKYGANKLIDFMGASELPHWVHEETYGKLYEKFLRNSTSRVAISDTVIVIEGTLTSSDSLKLFPIFYLCQPMECSLPDSGDYTLTFLDSSSNLITSYPFDIQFPIIEGDTCQVAAFSLILPYAGNIHSVKVSRGATSILTASKSANAPNVVIISPNGGEIWQGNQIITWSGHDLDLDSLSYIVQYSNDNVNWHAIATNQKDTFYIWNTDTQPGGNNCKIRILASDGFNTTEQVSNAFTINKKHPSCRITQPVESSTYVERERVPFSAEAYDLEDGNLPDSSLSWSSSIDGLIGLGRNLGSTRLSSGIHKIILSVHDSDANTAYDTITMVVLQDSDHDGMPDTWETAHLLDPNIDDSRLDPDNDGLDNISEYYLGTDPHDPDTDHDGYSDGDEVAKGSNPTDPLSIPTMVFFSQFALTYPANNANINNLLPTFLWNRSLPSDSSTQYGYIFYLDTDSSFGTPFAAVCTTSAFTPTSGLINNTRYYWKVKAADTYGHYLWSDHVGTFRTLFFIHGDANSDGKRTVSDAVYMVNYLFKGGPAPQIIESADCNCDGKVTVADVVYLINYLFKGGPPPPC